MQFFYETLQGQSQDQEMQALFGQLARVEIKHEERLFETYRQVAGEVKDREGFETGIVPRTLEGGFDAKEFLKTNQSHLSTAPEVLDLAMMLEAQSLDLYLRFVGLCEQAQTREVLYRLAEEEKAHLRRLGQMLEEKLGKRV